MEYKDYRKRILISIKDLNLKVKKGYEPYAFVFYKQVRYKLYRSDKKSKIYSGFYLICKGENSFYLANEDKRLAHPEEILDEIEAPLEGVGEILKH